MLIFNTLTWAISTQSTRVAHRKNLAHIFYFSFFFYETCCRCRGHHCLGVCSWRLPSDAHCWDFAIKVWVDEVRATPHREWYRWETRAGVPPRLSLHLKGSRSAIDRWGKGFESPWTQEHLMERGRRRWREERSCWLLEQFKCYERIRERSR